MESKMPGCPLLLNQIKPLLSILFSLWFVSGSPVLAQEISLYDTAIVEQYSESTGISSSESEPRLQRSRNVVYAEFLGISHFESINYERIFFRSGNVHFSGRAGVSLMEILLVRSASGENPGSGLNCGIGTPAWFPVSFNAMYGKKKNFLEANVGMTFSTQPDHVLFPSAGLAYRHQALERGIFLRISCYSMYTSVLGKVSLRPGLSVGYAFD
ncbi:MAG: hypothetical protein WD077_06955 [Bacteroidia bacterium]